ncbi:hypothetical protein PENSPDRAFT_750410 [Peniophora sp. CONT]|nr:hypothetical protein PENSPDRAFT_750410 [Peniophora sp. CONT]
MSVQDLEHTPVGLVLDEDQFVPPPMPFSMPPPSLPLYPYPPSPYLPSPAPPPPTLLALKHKDTRVLIKWPQTYEEMLESARNAFPALPSGDAKVYFETRVSIDTKDYKTKTEHARLTPEAWACIQPPWGPGMSVTELEVCTQRKWWGIGKAQKLGRAWDLERVLKAKKQ